MAEKTQLHDLDMLETDSDTEKLFSDLNQAIREANTQAIGATVGQITKTDLLRVAIAVARFRANYLATVVRLGNITGTEMPSAGELAELQRVRLVYEEGLEGFGALQHALKRGYFSLAEDSDAATPE